MTKRMLIDATHMEETRVVVLHGNRLEEFDFETSTKKQLKGNIYLAKVTRVEPSLQAAFVEYGGGRHGFLAFNEIHPDYYQIPVADRMALLKEEEVLAAESLEDGAGVDEDEDDHNDSESALADSDEEEPNTSVDAMSADRVAEDGSVLGVDDESEINEPIDSEERADILEEVGGKDEVEVQVAGHRRTRPKRQHYKIQEVIKRRQIILVQVVKEERGNKGAALTTYLSLAGRYCVLMPNTTKGGGISRKITMLKDRNRLKGFIADLDIPDGVAVILRTAAIKRSKAEIRRDFEYLIRIWQLVRDTTLQSIAPTLVYEEGNLIKRSIRDLYSKDMDNVLVEGEEGYRTAKDFMRMLMPSHAKRVQPYKDAAIPLYHRYQVDSQIDAMHSANVQLKSGGYIVINPTEALVAIDVNSGRATRERNIEETAYKTNLEAVEEIARQLKLRDLAGLIVIDFIDMMENRNQHTVERRLKDAMRSDRARIQIGRISPFGLLELSRQRLRPSLLEASTKACPHCEGSGLIRSTESAALHVLRAVEEEGIRRRSGEIHITVASDVALYILNEKRDMLIEIQNRHGFRVLVFGDDSLVPPNYELNRIADKMPSERPSADADQQTAALAKEETKTGEIVTENAEEEKPSRRRSRRRRPRRDESAPSGAVPSAAKQGGLNAAAHDDAKSQSDGTNGEATREPTGEEGNDKQRRRRRGRRGGRRHARRNPAETTEAMDATKTAGVGNNEADANASSVTAVSDDIMPDSTEATKNGGKKDTPKRRPRRTRTRTSSGSSGRTREKSADSISKETGAYTVPKSAEAGDETPKPRRRRSRTRKPLTHSTEPATDQAAAPRGGGNDAGTGSGNDARELTNGPAQGGNPSASKLEGDVPVVSATPDEKPKAKKRRGWWNRLTQ